MTDSDELDLLREFFRAWQSFHALNMAGVEQSVLVPAALELSAAAGRVRYCQAEQQDKLVNGAMHAS